MVNAIGDTYRAETGGAPPWVEPFADAVERGDDLRSTLDGIDRHIGSVSPTFGRQRLGHNAPRMLREAWQRLRRFVQSDDA